MVRRAYREARTQRDIFKRARAERPEVGAVHAAAEQQPRAVRPRLGDDLLLQLRLAIALGWADIEGGRDVRRARFDGGRSGGRNGTLGVGRALARARACCACWSPGSIAGTRLLLLTRTPVPATAPHRQTVRAAVRPCGAISGSSSGSVTGASRASRASYRASYGTGRAAASQHGRARCGCRLVWWCNRSAVRSVVRSRFAEASAALASAARVALTGIVIIRDRRGVLSLVPGGTRMGQCTDGGNA
jgi:hypothetical protein